MMRINIEHTTTQQQQQKNNASEANTYTALKISEDLWLSPKYTKQTASSNVGGGGELFAIESVWTGRLCLFIWCW